MSSRRHFRPADTQTGPSSSQPRDPENNYSSKHKRERNVVIKYVTGVSEKNTTIRQKLNVKTRQPDRKSTELWVRNSDANLVAIFCNQ